MGTAWTPSERAAALAGFVGFVRWASRYGHGLTDMPRGAIGGAEGSFIGLALSTTLSASFNFGYDPEDQSIFIAVDEEEFDWLSLLPIEEVVVGIGEVFIVTKPMEVEGEAFAGMAITVQTTQPKLWRAFPAAQTVGLMCIRHSSQGMEVAEIAGARHRIRYTND